MYVWCISFRSPKQVLLNTFPNCWWHHHGNCVHCTLHKGPNSGLPDMDMPIKVTGLIWPGRLVSLLPWNICFHTCTSLHVHVTCSNIHGNTCLTTFPFVLINAHPQVHKARSKVPNSSRSQGVLKYQFR